ncbi:MAG TPA: protocatechuate 3,4-dioxygenase subunit beta [Acidimicrobiales bacterium]
MAITSHQADEAFRDLEDYQRVPEGLNPPLRFPPYRSTMTRVPDRALVVQPHTLSELTGPVYAHRPIGPTDHDLTVQHAGPPVGERIIVHGRVVDGDGRPLRRTLVEIWQSNAAGRYRHDGDDGIAPLDPNFTGGGRTLTDDDGRYRFITVKPGPYPWKNHHNAWRPAHIHFSLFGPAFVTRLVTQMYFPGDPLFPFDPILGSVPEATRPRLISRFDLDAGVPEESLAYRWDIVLRGPTATPMER